MRKSLAAAPTQWLAYVITVATVGLSVSAVAADEREELPEVSDNALRALLEDPKWDRYLGSDEDRLVARRFHLHADVDDKWLIKFLLSQGSKDRVAQLLDNDELLSSLDKDERASAAVQWREAFEKRERDLWSVRHEGTVSDRMTVVQCGERSLILFLSLMRPPARRNALFKPLDWTDLVACDSQLLGGPRTVFTLWRIDKYFGANLDAWTERSIADSPRVSILGWDGTEWRIERLGDDGLRGRGNPTMAPTNDRVPNNSERSRKFPTGDGRTIRMLARCGSPTGPICLITEVNGDGESQVKVVGNKEAVRLYEESSQPPPRAIARSVARPWEEPLVVGCDHNRGEIVTFSADQNELTAHLPGQTRVVAREVLPKSTIEFEKRLMTYCALQSFQARQFVRIFKREFEFAGLGDDVPPHYPSEAEETRMLVGKWIQCVSNVSDLWIASLAGPERRLTIKRWREGRAVWSHVVKSDGTVADFQLLVHGKVAHLAFRTVDHATGRMAFQAQAFDDDNAGPVRPWHEPRAMDGTLCYRAVLQEGKVLVYFADEVCDLASRQMPEVGVVELSSVVVRQ